MVRALSWTVNILLIQKAKDLKTRKWYMRACIEQGWGRDILAVMIKSNAYERQGAAVTNSNRNTPAKLIGLKKPIGISENELTRALPEELKNLDKDLIFENNSFILSLKSETLASNCLSTSDSTASIWLPYHT
ncbi:MAG: DUF1016 domain-containing protein [bacterium]|nr:DUF1016 domain-containing protein [bacterium]